MFYHRPRSEFVLAYVLFILSTVIGGFISVWNFIRTAGGVSDGSFFNGINGGIVFGTSFVFTIFSLASLIAITVCFSANLQNYHFNHPVKYLHIEEETGYHFYQDVTNLMKCYKKPGVDDSGTEDTQAPRDIGWVTAFNDGDECDMHHNPFGTNDVLFNAMIVISTIQFLHMIYSSIICHYLDKNKRSD